MRRFGMVPLLIVTLGAGATAVSAAEDGKALYEAKCASCHGKDGTAKAMAKGSRSFNDPAFQSESVDAIVKVTADGKGKMPGYKDKLSADQMQAIAAHIKTLKPAK